MLLERANADILLAQYAISKEGNPANDEYMIDMAAYHVQQAIEKTLKYILRTKAGIDEETKGYKTHDIAYLIAWIEEKTLPIPDGLKSMDDVITEWESASRYGNSYISTVADIKEAIRLYFKLRETIDYYETGAH